MTPITRSVSFHQLIRSIYGVASSVPQRLTFQASYFPETCGDNGIVLLTWMCLPCYEITKKATLINADTKDDILTVCFLNQESEKV